MAYNKVVYDGNTLIDLTSDTVSSDKLLTGETAHDKTGAIIQGGLVMNKVYFGDSAPSSNLGEDGDIYIQLM